MTRRYDPTKTVEERNAEARARGAERRLQEAFAKNAMGGLTLSEALRTPEAQRSTKVRRNIKKLYRGELDEDNGQTRNQNFGDNGNDSADTSSGTDTTPSESIADDFSTEDITIVVDGIAVVRTFLTQGSSEGA